jgi:putative addiction module component (TIGR02574 family)
MEGNMSKLIDGLKAQLAVLPARDRAEIASFLIGSLDAEVDPDAQRAWDTELQRREEEINSGRAKGEPAERVLKRLRKKHS